MRFVMALLSLCACLRASDLVLAGGTVYPDPSANALPDAVVVIHGDRIAEVGPRRTTPIPPEARVIDCAGQTILAGFWNCHVHILAPGLLEARTAPAPRLNATLDEMFNRWGFTHVFDLASSLENTGALRRRIASGELRGPEILTVGEPLWTKPPVYVADFLTEHHIVVPETTTAEAATRRVQELADAGVNGIKLFAGSVQAGGVDNMPVALVRAAVVTAHGRNLPVFAHPQNLAGVDAAIDGGVDVLAHSVPEMPPWTPEFVAKLKARHIALIPTLTLFDSEGRKAGMTDAQIAAWLERMLPELRSFSSAGGEVLFGTDIGYTEHTDTALEFELMQRAGMTFRQILASLTTAPAARFGTREMGRVAVGAPTDLVVVNGDPAQSIAVLSHVAWTVRGGAVLYPGAPAGGAR